MKNDVQNNFLQDVQDTHKIVAELMKMPHYAKLGQEGIILIIETAKSLGLDPRMALNGGLYNVKGKIEMSARTMNALIRSRGHSITRCKTSDDTVCKLYGRRADNGDIWHESFSVQEAERAGLMNSPVWKTYTRDMLFARALSRLARQLFPDVIGSVYVEGEIALDAQIPEKAVSLPPAPMKPVFDILVDEDTENATQQGLDRKQILDELIGDDDGLRERLASYLTKAYGINDLSALTEEQFLKTKNVIQHHRKITL
jgi:hypothetical protein